MKMRNILITGSSGFIGSALVRQALLKGYDTFAGVRCTSSRKYLVDPGIRFLEMDLSDDQAMDIALRRLRDKHGRLDIVVHAAGVTKAVNPAEYRRGNYEHTRRLVEAVMRNDLIPGKFIYLSSLAAFGPGGEGAPISLAQRRNPVSEYGWSKLETEEYLCNLRDFPTVILNPTAVYGPRDPGFLTVLKCLQSGWDIRLPGEGRLLSFLHVEDLCQAVFRCIESPDLYGQFVLSDLHVYTQDSFAQIARAILNRRTIPVTPPAWAISGFVSITEAVSAITGKAAYLNRDRVRDFTALNWEADCSDIVELGFKPRFGLEEGLRQTIGWYRDEGWLRR
jgi:UDP-glucose 4-epimerase